jgi:hypothetical protein
MRASFTAGSSDREALTLTIEVGPMTKANRKLSRFAKRHYEAIAEAMQEARTHLRCDAINQHECVVGMLADMFAADNSQFKRERFTNACQPGANVRARS